MQKYPNHNSAHNASCREYQNPNEIPDFIDGVCLYCSYPVPEDRRICDGCSDTLTKLEGEGASYGDAVVAINFMKRSTRGLSS